MLYYNNCKEINYNLRKRRRVEKKNLRKKTRKHSKKRPSKNEEKTELLQIGSHIEVQFNHSNYRNYQKYYKAKVISLDAKDITLKYNDGEISTYSIVEFVKFVWRFSKGDKVSEAAEGLLLPVKM